MNSAKVWGVVVLACVIGCGGGGDSGGTTGPGTGPGPGPGPGQNPGGSTSNAIDVRDNSFNPSETTVAPGTTVTWTWRGSAEHDVVFTDGASSPRRTTGTYSRAFPTAGTFAYECSVHGASMSGEVVVR
jgi:plastocyanin